MRAAESEKISGIQERLRRDTDRMMRLFGARSVLGGATQSVLGRL